MAGDRAGALALFAMEPAAQHQPFVGPCAETLLVAFVSLEIVGRHASRRPVNQVGLGEAALVHLVGRALKHGRIVIDYRLVDAYRLNDAELIKDENDIGEYAEVRSASLYYLMRAIRTVALFHRALVLLPCLGAPSVRHDPPAALAIDRSEVELRAAVSEIARERVSVLSEDRLHVDLASLGDQHHRRVMQDVGMVAVDRVLKRHLPVALERMLEHARAQHHLAFGRQVDKLID